MKKYVSLASLYLCLSSTASYSMLTTTRLTHATHRIVPICYAPTIQKRKISGYEAPFIVMSGVVLVGGIWAIVLEAAKPKKPGSEPYKRQAYAYFRECAEKKHTELINETTLRSFDCDANKRLQFLLNLKHRYEQLQCVEDEEIQQYLQFSQEESLVYRRDTTLNIIDEQQQRIFAAARTIEEDMALHHDRLIQHYTNILGETRVSSVITNTIEQELQKQRTIIQHIKQLHEKPMQRQITEQE